MNPFNWLRAWLKAPFFSFSIRFFWTGDKEDQPMTKFASPKEFLEAIRIPALEIEGKTGIPWMFAATQAAHESRYGNSLLAIEANNLFGVTAEGSWQHGGKPVYLIETKEYDAAHQPYFTKRPFRKYAGYEDCLEDWASLIMRRYPRAYAAAKNGDFSIFAVELQQGGYATDPKYAMQLQDMHTVLEATV